MTRNKKANSINILVQKIILLCFDRIIIIFLSKNELFYIKYGGMRIFQSRLDDRQSMRKIKPKIALSSGNDVTFLGG